MYSVIFFGSSEFAVPALEKLASSRDFLVSLVVSQRDEPSGRERKLAPTPVKSVAEKLGLEVYTPEKIIDKTVVERICGNRPDFLVLAAYGQILPKEILECAKYGPVNIHPSLLPKYRGASPLQQAILNGDEETGVTIMFMDERLDHGPILAQEEARIKSDETAPELKSRLARVGADLLLLILPKFAASKIKPKEQDHAKATFTKIIKRQDGRLDWKKSAREIYNMWRAYEPWPGVFTELRIRSRRFDPRSEIRLRRIEASGKQELRILKLNKIKIADLRREKIEQHKIGEVFVHDKKLFVKCGKGAVELEKLQLGGKKEVAAYAFIQGHHEFIGSVLT